ncbi:pyridoxal 5'-phosphate synthase [Streptomyces seoulensis]|uniref:pyridoxine/pyridoxamine 5'-phosphate oxidase n=1 Tax=Streptomyces seoulensis TaxID=73044 RepID=UPI0036739582
MAHEAHQAPDELDGLLRSLKVWSPDTTELRPFDPDTAPPTPLPLFTAWLADAARAGQPEPHAMSLATVDEEGRPDVRVLLLHGADADAWTFGTHSTSRKGRDLIAHPYAALAFYWPALGRQVRVRGPVTAAPAEAAQADLRARSTGALAAALTGRQSEDLGSLAELRRASEDAWSQAREHPTTPAPTWNLYRLHPRTVEFFQGDPDRRHVRLEYRRTEFGWERCLLWP